jgi:Flp pilus assembly protein protease CpaA
MEAAATTQELGLFAALIMALMSAPAAATDAYCRRIPNASCALIALAAVAILGVDAVRLATAAGVLLAGAALAALWRALTKTQGIGAGDIKFAAAWALGAGPAALLGICIACALALAVALVRKQRTFAFAPALSLGLFLSVVYTYLGM